jgi:hypothetical protein
VPCLLQYNLSLKVPRSGAYSDLAVEAFVPIVVSPAGDHLDIDPFVPPPVYAPGTRVDSSGSANKKDGDDSGWEDGWGGGAGSGWSGGSSSATGGGSGRKGESAVV